MPSQIRGLPGNYKDLKMHGLSRGFVKRLSTQDMLAIKRHLRREEDTTKAARDKSLATWRVRGSVKNRFTTTAGAAQWSSSHRYSTSRGRMSLAIGGGREMEALPGGR